MVWSFLHILNLLTCLELIQSLEQMTDQDVVYAEEI